MGIFKDKMAVITCSNKGIRLASAQRFSAEGLKVVITGHNLADLKKARSIIEADVMVVQSVASDANE